MMRPHRGPVMIGDRIIMPTPPGLWSAPREWEGETAFIIGGGPSLRGFDAECLRGRRVIATNEAGLTICPWADVLFWADRRWLEWNVDRLHLHTGRYKVTRQPMRQAAVDGVGQVKFEPKAGYADQSWAVSGHCGGSSAINLAGHFGATRIILLGFDMHDLPMERWREGNFHAMHREPPLENQRAGKFIPALERMAPHLVSRGIEVLNATPGSALMVFPMVDLKDCL